MTDLLDRNGGTSPPPPPAVHPHAVTPGDQPPVTALPLILNDTYVELGGVNLRCLAGHIEVAPENKPVTVTSFCAEVDYPGVTKWHIRLTFHQSFDTGAVYDTLAAALANYNATGQPVPFKARPYSSRPPSANNPVISGMATPQPFEVIMGDAGAASQCQIDWTLTGPPSVDKGVVTVTGAVGGMPGYYEPTGASIPADLAALSGVAATPSSAWDAGYYVITGDLLAASWDGTAWVEGKA
jgi:hypothetical protein